MANRTRTGLAVAYLGLIVAWSAMSAPAHSPEQDSHAASVTELATHCKELTSGDFSDIPDAPTQLLAATSVTAAGDLPEYCRVEGYVSPNVGFRLGLPSTWNGKFIELGCGGHCGSFDNDYVWGQCDRPLQRGYACMVSDMGHRGSGADALWGKNNLQAKVDWGYRAAHVVALAGKAITERYYTHHASKSYFMGCSTGGRQALQEAQRFPWDFDGIVAGAPPISLATLYLNWAWEVRAVQDSAGHTLLGREELKLANAAALAQCDLDDGVKDGIIGNPQHCAFNPATLTCKPGEIHGCLRADQIEALKKLYAGPTTSQGVKLSPGGILPGSEYTLTSRLRPDDTVAEIPLLSDGLRYLFFPEQGSSWTLRDIDFDRDSKRLGVMGSLYDASNPDLRQFKAAGGKMIAYQGLNDHMARSAIDYYETVQRTMGGKEPTQSFFRLFLQPGVGHCGLGDGTFDSADYLRQLEAWVEQGQAPETLITSHIRLGNLNFNNPDDVHRLVELMYLPPDPASVESTRPSYPYPTLAKYLGRGDPNDAANFGPEKH